MSGRILIIDSVATNRIVLKVKLLTAQYTVHPVSSPVEARRFLETGHADLILLEMTSPSADLRAFCTEVRQTPETATIPIIATGHFDRAEQRLAALECGADDALSKPMSDMLLLARIRSLLRARDADDELRLRDDTSRALGFAEETRPFTTAPKVASVSEVQTRAIPFARALGAELGTEVRTLTPDTVVGAGRVEPVADLFIIDARTRTRWGDDGRLFRLVSDLRSRSETRHAAQLVIAPDDAADLAAMALDLGANDVVPGFACASEIAIRARKLIRRKTDMDRLRDTVRSGLRAAVTDPLTGLYNRRYAIPHLTALSDQAARTDRDFTLMVMDIDHFKQINDTYGHHAGDLVLKGVSELLRENLRTIDLVARIGGEEFLVAMPDTNARQAARTAERLRELIEVTDFEVGANTAPVRITLSIGVTVCGPNPMTEPEILDVIDRADIALYTSKRGGRNMVTFWQTAA